MAAYMALSLEGRLPDIATPELHPRRNEQRNPARNDVSSSAAAGPRTPQRAAAASAPGVADIIASTSSMTRSGTAFWTMWPMPGSTISFTFGAVAANGREWMLVDTVLSASPVMMVTGALISA